VPVGVRCTFQDDQVNLWGRDPATGFARRPLDNTGVQYGLAAFRSGVISAADFVALNAAVGGLDIDGRFVAQRMDMGAVVAGIAYASGRVTGRGSLDQTPIIDSHPNLDAVPVVDVHDDARPFMVRARLDAHAGGHGNLALWQGGPYPSASFAPAEQWLSALDARGATDDDASRAKAVAAARPASAADRCTVLAVGVDGTAPCEALAGTSPRIAAGGPATEDVIKCALAPIVPAAYPGLSASDLDALRRTFPTGVCDWARPGVGETARSTPWVSFGDGSRPPVPRPLTNQVARSAVPGTDVLAARAARAALPATGGQRWLLAGAALLALGLAFRGFHQARRGAP
jgi:hypothetical protein